MFLPPNVLGTQLQPLASIPPNLAAKIDPTLQKDIMKWMYDNYVFPQVLERQQYEPLWDKLLNMYRIEIKSEDLKLNVDDGKKADRLEEIAVKGDKPNRAQVADTIVFDAVDRLKNLNHFISWKDGSPIQYNVPDHYTSSKEGTFYHPLADKIESANGLLQWNIDNHDVYRTHLILSGHHYLYGCSFAYSEFEYQILPHLQRVADGSIQNVPELAKIGVSFDPVSIRRIWLNYRIPVYQMEMQPCPFMFEEMPRFAVLNNPYDPTLNPFGYLNLDKLPTPQWLFQQQEMESLRTAVYSRLGGTVGSEMLAPEFSIEGKWKFFPMLPLDPETGEWESRADGSPVPLTRYIVEWFGVNLREGEMFPIRIQKLFYPMGQLPLYASQHMPDMDSGAYSLSIGEVLKSHYEQICTAKNQWLDNKNLINNPPWWSVIGTPVNTQDPNAPGAHIEVTGPNDFGWRTVPDSTGTTTSMLEYLSQQAKTSSKATEAILGQAMGGRTSATEAQNVFQAAMSGVTTDINIFNHDIMGGYADRVWNYCGLWMPQQLIKVITGQYGEPLTIEDLNARVMLKWDVGSTYIESIVTQQHLQYAIQAASTSPALNQAVLFRQYFKVIKCPMLQEAVNDDGLEEQIGEATEQAVETYLGMPTMIDPTQNHQIALEVKSRYLKDIKSTWNTQYGAMPDPSGTMTRAQNLAQQCAIHQQFIMQQMQQQMAQQQLAAQAQLDQENQQRAETSQGNQRNPGRLNKTAGQANQ